MDTSMNSPNIKITVGKIAIEYSGDQTFIENGLLSLVESIVETSAKLPSSVATGQSDGAGSTTPSVNVQHMSTNTIASQMSAKSGPDLVMAAITHLQLVQNNDKVHRSNIVKEIKSATTYYKTTYTGNLSSYLDGLVKGKRLNLVGDKTYALTATERQKMESILAAA